MREDLAKALYEAAPEYRYEQSGEDAWSEHVPIPWAEASQHARDRSYALARAASKFYGIEGDPEAGCVQHVRELLRQAKHSLLVIHRNNCKSCGAGPYPNCREHPREILGCALRDASEFVSDALHTLGGEGGRRSDEAH